MSITQNTMQTLYWQFFYILKHKKAGQWIFSSIILLIKSTTIFISFFICLLNNPYHSSNPINHPKHPAGKYPIQNHRPCNGKYFTPNPKDLPFCLCQVRTHSFLKIPFASDISLSYFFPLLRHHPSQRVFLSSLPCLNPVNLRYLWFLLFHALVNTIVFFPDYFLFLSLVFHKMCIDDAVRQRLPQRSVNRRIINPKTAIHPKMVL